MKTLLPIFTAIFISTSAIASPPTINKVFPAAASRINQAAEAFMRRDSIPGLELAVLVNGETVYECGYGFADSQAQTVPGPRTYFQIDSVTKAFTAMGVLKLVEEGKVNLDDPVSKYISLPNDAWKPITVRMMLTMTSGMPSGGSMNGSYKKVVERVAQEQGAYGIGLATKPGTAYLYSNVSYFLLGELIAAASGQTYIDYEKSEILNPMGMEHTGFLRFDSLQDCAVPHIDGSPVKPRVPASGFSGGGFTSTIRDMEKFARALYNRRVLSRESYRAMWTPHVLPDGQPIPWGMGWDVKSDEVNHFSTVYGKNGGGYGWSAQINYYADKGVTVIVLANSEAKGIVNLCIRAAKAVAGP